MKFFCFLFFCFLFVNPCFSADKKEVLSSLKEEVLGAQKQEQVLEITSTAIAKNPTFATDIVLFVAELVDADISFIVQLVDVATSEIISSLGEGGVDVALDFVQEVVQEVPAILAPALEIVSELSEESSIPLTPNSPVVTPGAPN